MKKNVKNIKEGVCDPVDYPYLIKLEDLHRFAENELGDCKDNSDSQILIMVGHFMAHYEGNVLYPSYLPLDQVPFSVAKQRVTEKMKTFSGYTFEYGCQLTAGLIKLGYNVQMFILGNDITHVLDAYQDPANIKPGSTPDPNNLDADKIFTMHELRQRLLADFYTDSGLPLVYQKELEKNGLNKNDHILSFSESYSHTTPGGKKKWKTREIFCIRELTLQNLFDRFAKYSAILKEPFGYGRGNNDEALEAFMGSDPVLSTMLEEMMYCAMKDVPEMPGGLACSKEMISLYALLFGVRDEVSTKVPTLYKSAKKVLYNVVINLIPMGCRNAVVSASLISYRKIHPEDTHLRIINIPCASNAVNTNIQLLNGLRDR